VCQFSRVLDGRHVGIRLKLITWQVIFTHFLGICSKARARTISEDSSITYNMRVYGFYACDKVNIYAFYVCDKVNIYAFYV
jgi:hypothetical protein